MFNPSFPISFRTFTGLAFYLLPSKTNPTRLFNLPAPLLRPTYDVYRDPCIIIIVRYYDNFVTGLLGVSGIRESPFIITNPLCPAPIQPSPKLDITPRFGDPRCTGDILILHIPIHTVFHREQTPLQAVDMYSKLTGTLINVEFPIEDEGDITARFTINWVREAWVAVPVSTSFLNTDYFKRDISGSKEITYICEKGNTFQDTGDYARIKKANINDSYQFSFFNRGFGNPGISLPLFDVKAYIGKSAKLFYDAEYKSNSNFNPYTGDVNPGTNFRSGDPQYLFFNLRPDGFFEDYREYCFYTQCYSSPVRYQDPPPRPPRDPDMNCCQNHEQLLRLILRRIGELPANVPASLTAKNPGTRRINSIAEYIAWQTIQQDALMGQFPIDLKIEDSDLTRSGNQQQTIELPNVAESIAEIVGLLILLKRESGVNLETGIKALIEAGQAKQAATVSADISLANAEYLGYELKQKKQDIGFSFTPNETKIDQFLKPKKEKYLTYENTDKRSLRDAILPLLNMAARWNAQNFVRVSTNVVKGVKDIYELLNRGEKTEQQAKQAEDEVWSDWREEVEDGFSQDPRYPPDDRNQPYGRERDERPKIRKLGEPI